MSPLPLPGKQTTLQKPSEAVLVLQANGTAELEWKKEVEVTITEHVELLALHHTESGLFRAEVALLKREVTASHVGWL